MAIQDTLLKNKAYINGEWVGADSGDVFEVTSERDLILRIRGLADDVDPATGEVIGSVPDQREPETLRAIAAAEEAFKGWSTAPPKASYLKDR